jgi:hypothetical protein
MMNHPANHHFSARLKRILSFVQIFLLSTSAFAANGSTHPIVGYIENARALVKDG